MFVNFYGQPIVFVGQNVINVQDRKICSRRDVFEKKIGKNASNSDLNRQKFQKFSFFNAFMQILSILRKTWWLRILKTFNKEKEKEKFVVREAFVDEIVQQQ